MQRFTVLTKTFERPTAAKNLVASVRRFYPDIPIVVVDDSREPSAIPGVTYLRMPFDSGASAGRNFGVAHVATEFTFYCDDDHEFTEVIDLLKLRTLLDNHALDILAVNADDWSPPAFFEVKPNGLHLYQRQPVRWADGVEIYQVIPQRFLARTASLRACPWPEWMKTEEHWAWLFENRNKLKIGYLPQVEMRHRHKDFNTPSYDEYRFGRMHFQAEWNRRNGFAATYNLSGRPF